MIACTNRVRLYESSNDRRIGPQGVFRKIAPTMAERIADPLTRIAGIVLLIGVLCILAFSLPTALARIGNGTIVAFVAFVIVGLTVGHLFGGPGSEQRVT